MQNRRIFNDDHRGVDDWHNEMDTDTYGPYPRDKPSYYGIHTQATYYLQLTNATT